MCGKNKHLTVLFLLVFALGIFSLLTSTASATTGVSPDVSFEGKIVNSSGVNITNATYNVEFTMYTGCSNEPTNNTGCTLAWTEDYLTSATQGVAMNGGTFEVNLGQYCAFSGGSCQGNTNTGINWNTYPIYMSMQIGQTTNCTPAGNFTTNCTGDSVMQPYILMTSTPYAQNAGTLGGLGSGSFAQLGTTQTFTGSNTFETNSASALTVENTSTQALLTINTSTPTVNLGVTGSVALGSTVTINNSSGGIELTNIGSTALSSATVLQGGSGSLSLTTGTAAGNITLTTNNAASSVIAKSSTNTTTAFQVQNASSVDVLNVDTQNAQVDVGALTAPGTLTATQAPLAGSLTGTAGSTSYTYEITAVSANGAESLAATETNAALASSITTHNITVSWTNNTGAAYYKIYRTASGGTPSSLGLVGTATTSPFVDTGYTAGAQPPALANTGSLAVSTNYYYEVTALDDTYTTTDNIGQTPPSAQLTATTNSYNKSLTISWAPVNGARAYNVYRSTTSGVFTTDSYYTVYTNSFTDTNTGATGTNTTPPTTSTAYSNTISDNANANVTIGDSGTETGQLYVGGSLAVDSVINTGPGSDSCGVAVQGDYAYVTNYSTDTFQVYNVANPDNPVLLSSQSVTGACGVSIEGDYAYVIDYSSSYLDVFNISNPTAPIEVSSVPTNTTPTSLDISGHYAYITNAGTDTLQVFDISNPTNPVVVDSVTTGAFPNDVSVQGDYAYVINTNDTSLEIFNISNPTNIPTAVSITGTASDAQALSVQGNYAYLAENSISEMQVYDISNPTDPVLVDSFTTTSQPSGIYVQGRYAYLAENAASVQAVDISNPADPLNAGSVGLGTQGGTGRTPDIITVQGRYAYMLGGATGNNLQIIDLGGAYVQQLQAGGIETGTLQVDSNANVSGDESVVGGLNVGSSAQVTGSLNVGGSITTSGSLAIAGSFSAMASPVISAHTTLTTGGSLTANTYYYEVTAVDALGRQTTPSAQVSQATTGSASTVTLTWAPIVGAQSYDVYRSTTTGVYTTDSVYSTVGTVSGANLTFTDTGATAAITNTAPPTTTTAQVATNTSNTNLQVSIGGNGTPSGQLYVSGTIPTSAIGNLYTGAGTEPAYIYVQGQYAYIVESGTNNFQVVNVSSPASPIVVGNVTTNSSPNSIFVQGNYAYVGDWAGNLQIINISNPSNPVITATLGVIDGGGAPITVYVQGNYAYTGEYGGGLTVINISNPSNPMIVGNIVTGTDTDAVFVQGNYAYIGNQVTNTFQIINISNPNNPVLAGSVASNTPASIFVQGDYAYVGGNGSPNMQIVNISNPSSPVVTGGINSGIGTGQSIYVQGQDAYVANWGSAVQVVNISNPTDPVLVGSIATGDGGASGANGIFVQGRYAYDVDGGANTFQIFDMGGEYTQQLQAGSAEVGTLQVDSNANVSGNESVSSGLSVGGAAQLSGNTNVGGNLSVVGLTQLEGVTAINGVYGGYNSSGLAGPSAPSITFSGNTGTAVTWSYEVEAVDAAGNTTAVSPAGSITTADSLGLGLYSSQSVTSTTFATPHITYNVASGQPFLTGMGITVTGCSGTAADNGTYTITSETTSTIVVSNASGVAGETGCTIGSEINSNIVSWPSITGAVNYYVFRTVDAAGGSPSTTGFIGATPGTSLVDNGDTGSATYLAQSSDTTNSFIYQTATNSATAFQVQNAAGNAILAVNTDSSAQVAVNASLQVNGVSVAGVGAIVIQQSDAVANGTAIAVFGSNTTIGNTVVLMAQVSSATDDVGSVTGGGVASWTKIPGASIDSGGYDTEMWYGTVTSATSNAITVVESASGSDAVRLIAAEVYGLSGSPVDQSATNTYTGATNPTTPTINTTTANEVIFGYAKDGGLGYSLSSPTNGFTQLNQPVTFNALAYFVANAKGSYSTSFTASGSDNGEVGIVSFKLASAPQDLIDVNASPGNTALAISAEGAATFKNVSNSPTALSVQNSSGSNILNVDTTSSQVDIGAIAAPGTLTATQAPIAGTATGSGTGASYSYEITAVSANGAESLGSTETDATNGTTLSTNPITINWTANGASYYKIYRTATTGGTSTSIGLLGTSTTSSFIDNGYSAGADAPALATTGTLVVSTTYDYEVTALDETYYAGGQSGQTSPSTQLAAATNATNKSLTISWAPVSGARAYIVYRTISTGSYTTTGYDYIVYTNSFTDTNATANATNTALPTSSTAYANTISDNVNSNVTIGDNGTETGQLYVGGSVTATSVGSNPSLEDNQIFASGNYLYNLNGTALQIVNVANPANPVLLSTTTTAGTSNGTLAVEGNYAYIADSSSLQIFNISNPSSPVSLSNTNTGAGTNSLAVEGNYAYVINNSTDTLEVLNIANPANPYIIGNAVTESSPWGITLQGNYAYVISATGSNQLQIFNISNPSSPVAMGIAPVGAGPFWVYVQGNYAYVADDAGSVMAIVDVSNPANPYIVSDYSAGSNVFNVYVQGRYAYITTSSGNMQVVDISNAANPLLVSSVSVGTYAYGLYVQGRYAYVGNVSGGGLQIFDLGGAYIQQLQTGGVETGTLQVDSNANVGGAESIVGGLSVGNSAQISGDTGVGGNLTVVGLTQLEGVTTINGVYGGYSSIGLAPPSAPTVTFTGATGTAGTWSYKVEALDAAGNTTAASAVGTISASDNEDLGSYAYQSVTSVTFATPHVTYNVPSGQPFLTGMSITVTGCSGTGADNGTYAITSETTATIVVSDASGVAGETGCSIALEVNSNVVSWTPVTGAVNYYVFRTADAAGGTPATTGYIGSTTGTSLVDNGIAGTATYIAQATDSTNTFTDETATNSAAAFQVDNALGEPILLVGTIGNNLLSYPGFEAGSFTDDAVGWQSVGTGTISQNSVLANTYNGLYSMKLVTTTTAGAGARTDAFTGTIAAATYDVSFYVLPSVAMNANAFTVTLDDTTTHTCSPAAATLSTAGFTLLNCSVTTTGGLTYLSIAQNDTTARTIYIDAVQLQTGAVATPYSIGTIQLRGEVASPVIFEAPSNSQTTFQILNSSNANLFNVDSLDGVVEIGSTSSTNTTQTLLQLNSDNTFSEAATCSTTTNQGALYYNNVANNIRACINGSWQDLVSTQALALLLFGVVPNSGPSPGDLIGSSATATANTGSPCEVSYDNATPTSVYINSCLAYSGGREINWAGGAIAAPTGAHTYQNVCFTSAGVPALEGTSSTTWGSETFNNLTLTSGITDGQPLLCLATIETGATTGSMAGGTIYDTRTFTTTNKEYVSMASATAGVLGSLVGPSTTAGQETVTPVTTTTTAVTGVVIASADTAEATSGVTNVIIAYAGPQWILASSATLNDLITPGGATDAGMALAGTTTGTFAYNMVGINLNTYGSGTCGTALYGTTDCQKAVFTYIAIQ